MSYTYRPDGIAFWDVAAAAAAVVHGCRARAETVHPVTNWPGETWEDASHTYKFFQGTPIMPGLLPIQNSAREYSFEANHLAFKAPGDTRREMDPHILRHALDCVAETVCAAAGLPVVYHIDPFTRALRLYVDAPEVDDHVRSRLLAHAAESPMRWPSVTVLPSQVRAARGFGEAMAQLFDASKPAHRRLVAEAIENLPDELHERAATAALGELWEWTGIFYACMPGILMEVIDMLVTYQRARGRCLRPDPSSIRAEVLKVERPFCQHVSSHIAEDVLNRYERELTAGPAFTPRWRR